MSSSADFWTTATTVAAVLAASAFACDTVVACDCELEFFCVLDCWLEPAEDCCLVPELAADCDACLLAVPELAEPELDEPEPVL